MKRSLTVAVAACAALAWPAAPSADDLTVHPAVDVPVTLLAGALAAGLALPQLSPSHCRFCAVNRLDEAARDAIRLPGAGAALRARHISDVIDSGVLSVGAVTLSALGAAQDGMRQTFFEDMLVVAESVAIASDLANAAKDGFARPRPAGGSAFMPGSRDRSFYSGHTSFAFSLATATATVATIRGRSWAPWAWGAGLTLATGVGYLRMAGDAHWLTDVVAGAAVGSAVGFAVPWFFHRRSGPRRRRGLDLQPAPGGIALVF
ncbi:phosphatase PAP2 family protein [Anaeromyxobacter terrae]|uniref:phosphatase PAP2 family protein n=1 Tax=Anaeromyxobacter terrae TaxID=2925406 RepID=UPI001F5A75A4|nr:phosphatase PAP2 family protein [Anaeromyxobacter sp. SG22]